MKYNVGQMHEQLISTFTKDLSVSIGVCCGKNMCLMHMNPILQVAPSGSGDAITY
jgi:hypothetical protein